MTTPLLHVHDLRVNISDKEILKSLSLDLFPGKVAVLMGQNGSGKSTLAQTLMGNPQYVVTSGKVAFDGEDLLEKDPTARALQGLFLSFQYPSEVTGVTISSFLRLIYNKRHKQNLSPAAFRKLLAEKMLKPKISGELAAYGYLTKKARY